jgi:hypothetical protein
VNLKKRTLEAAACAAGGALLLTLVAAPAGASGMPRPPRSNFAGFSGNVAAGITTETATVILPTITCVKKTSLDVQLTISSAADDGAAVIMSCSKGPHVHGLVLTYVPVVVVGGSMPSTASVNPMPGDTITMTLNCSSSANSVTLDDVTSGETVTGTYTGPLPLGEPCDFMSVGSVVSNLREHGLPEMNSLAWTNVTVNGGPLSSPPLMTSSYFESFRKGTLTTGPLTNGGTAFTETYAPPAL